MRITSFEHVGIRVTQRDQALGFYERLGFALVPALSDERVAELVTADGVRINLIFNGIPTRTGGNILLDEADKWPGYTHAAFVVARLETVLEWANRAGVRITEGPVDWGRRLACFLRDPDGNVLEFTELKARTDEASADSSRVKLVIGSKNYSSWSMRAWLLLRWLKVPFDEITVPLYSPGSRDALLRYSPAARVPVLIDGALTIWDTMAIVTHMADMHPQVWPAAPAKRAYARSICAEMHSGFQALRAALSYNARARNRRVALTADVVADIDRIQDIWEQGRERFGTDGPWLLGEFGIADIMFAPLASRFVTYGVGLRESVRDYHGTLLAHALVGEWFDLGRTDAVISACEVGIVAPPART